MDNGKSNQENNSAATERKVKIFRDLALHESECVYLDFKEKLYLKKVKEKKEFIKDVLSMYNALSENLHSGIVGSGMKSAYILIGISYKDGKKEFKPLNESCILHLDDSDINEITYHSITPTSFVKLHKLNYEGCKDIPGGLYALVEVIRGKEGPAVRRNTPDEIYSRFDATNIHPSKLKESDKKKIYSFFSVTFDDFRLNAIYEELHIKEMENAFTVLMINDPGCYLKKDQEYFVHAVISVKWNIIIDMDHWSRRNGFGETIGKGFLKVGNTQFPVTYDKLDRVDDGSISNFADNISTLYILADGCADANIAGPDKQQKVKVPVCKIAEKIFKKVTCPRPVLCFVMAIGSKKVSWYDNIVTALDDAYNASGSAIGDEAFHVKYFVTQKEYQDSIGLGKGKEVLVSPLHQIATLFLKLFKHQNTEFLDDVSIPGRTGSVLILPQNYNRIRNCIQLYSLELQGNLDVTADDIEQLRLNYLKGERPTVQLMAMHEKSSMFVVRKEYKEFFRFIKDRVQNLVKHPFNVRWKCAFITHDPSAGGSTAGKWLLWQLHNDFPCMEIIKFNSEDDIVTELKDLYRISYLPLVIMLDSNNFTNVIEVQKRLSMALINCTVPVFFIAVVRLDSGSKYELLPTSQSRCTEYLTQELQDEDRSFFNDLYERVRKSSTGLNNADRVYLFGLFSFVKEYTKISEIIEQCLQDATPEQMSVIHTASMITWYTGQSLPFHLAAKLLKPHLTAGIVKTVCNLQTSPKTLLGEASLLLVANDIGFRCPHRCMTTKLLDKCLPQKESHKEQIVGCSGDKGDEIAGIHYQPFFENFTNILVPPGTDELYEKTCRLLFFKIRALNYEETHYSLLIENMLKKLGASDTVIHLENTVNRLEFMPLLKAHIRAVVAKLYMHQLFDTEASLKAIETAVTEVTDSAILHNNHGDLLKTCLRNEINKSGCGVQDQKRVLELFIKVLLIFQRAKECDPDESQLPWYSLGELKTHIFLLEYVHRKCFKKDFSRLHSAVQNPEDATGDAVSTSYNRSLEILDKLDLHLEREPNAEAERGTFRCWLKLFQLWGDNPTYRKLVKYVPFGIVQRVRLSESQGLLIKHWDELEISELETIVETLSTHIPDTINELSFHRHSFNDLLKAMIWLRCKKSSKTVKSKCNINTAIHFSDKYKKAFLFDHNAFFFSGIFHVLMGLQLVDKGKENLDHSLTNAGEFSIRKGMESLKKCREKVEKYSHFQKLLKVQYIIGCDTDLGALIPRQSLDSEKQSKLCNFRVFQGRLINNESIFVREYRELIVKCQWKKFTLNKLKKQQPLLKFNIGFSFKNGAVAWNEEIVNADE